ncbi:FixH family protein [Bacillus aquiflavi]|uniref:FixH family protein n=1 Tax=Bacillus aquiflavi TaxID=2672567 RepID=A0A6B3W2U5_9BACI|nr:FixH family protein [Bacillus aquiflavi]MBA4537970.1 FixH family protein [Bacillus aquiflavi]NEY82226.1 FixH family protein [Bacillus aquiflavi]UAC49877.1 FixH family protein [Bacillus aquiflavi]
MKKSLILMSILLLAIVSACSNNESAEDEPQFLDVQLSVNPNKAEPNETIVFEAKVTYGDEEVTDADEVKFEVWRAHDEDHETIVVEHAENGIYRLEKSFAEEGTYYMISHVTARSMHNMPKEEFVVGEPSEPEEETNSTIMDEEEQPNDEGENQ